MILYTSKCIYLWQGKKKYICNHRFLTCGRVVWYIFRFFFFRFKRGTLSKYFLYRDSVCAQCFKMFFLLLVVRLLHLNRYDLILLTLAIALNYGLSCLILGYTYILTMVYCLKWVGLFNFVSFQEHAGILSTWSDLYIQEWNFFAVTFKLKLQGCWANSYDGNFKKVVRISPIM